MDGILVVNKEKGCTSHDVVYQVKKLFGKKVGHTGTLDPNATGVLPILIGKGTELSQFLINHDKKYIATIKLGIKTDTADVEGNVVEEQDVKDVLLNEENINLILKNMIGKQKQIPPMYSAIKVNGKKLYEYARQGKSVNIPEREIEIYSLKLLNIDKIEKLITYEIYCSKGTYVRTVCEKIAEQLGTVGYMLDLQRTMVGEFNIENAITVGDLKNNFENEEFVKSKIITIERFFDGMPNINLEEKKMNLFLNGVLIENEFEDGILKIYDMEGIFIGIGINSNKRLKRKIIL